MGLVLLFDLLLIGVAFAIGGVIKGAIGAGSAVVAIPILVLLYDVPTAVTIFALPNVISNSWQVWQYRAYQMRPLLVWQFVLAGAFGVIVGTFLLKHLSGETLSLIVAGVVAVYIAFRLLRPDWRLAQDMALKIAAPVGALAGMLQGASGISAPISITFLNAMKPDQRAFVATISVFFLVVGSMQAPLLFYFGLLSFERAGISILALAVMIGFMPVGAALIKKVSPKVFDRIILCMLAALSVRLAWGALIG